MGEIELGVVQERFADIVWANEPIGSGELVKICERELNWKKPTTYTVLRKLCEKGLFQNQDGVVTSLISKEAFYCAKSEQVIEDSYAGSLPAFVAAFLTRKKLTDEEAAEIQRMIDSAKYADEKQDVKASARLTEGKSASKGKRNLRTENLAQEQAQGVGKEAAK